MGQAKRRGTFEERKATAMLRGKNLRNEMERKDALRVLSRSGRRGSQAGTALSGRIAAAAMGGVFETNRKEPR